MLKIEQLKKRYDDFLLNCSLEVPSGTITGLIGQNGSGKSTTFKAALGLISIDGGTITLLGKDRNRFTPEDREKLGVVLSDSGFSGYLTIKDIIPVLKNLYHNFEYSFFVEQIQRFQLPPDKKIKEFSTGMKAKLKVLVAVSHNAKLLLLDEPTAGLDVIARDEVLGILREFMEREEERAILISSHISSDLETLCDDIYMLHNGRIVLHEDTDVLMSDYALLKVDDEQYGNLDRRFILRSRKEPYGYSCLTNEKQYYIDNYPKIAIEKGTIDEVITMIIRGAGTMKGLFIKDFELLKLQKNFFFVIVAISIGLAVSNDSPAFMLGFLIFVLSLFPLTTITYDEFDNGNAFLFTLPVSRTGYVVEKYSLSLFVGSGSWILAVVLAVFCNAIKGTVPVLDVVMTAGMIFPVMLLIYAAMLPFQLKFGGEKGRIAMIGAVGLLFVVGLLAVKIAAMAGLDLPNILNGLPLLNMGLLVAAFIIIAAMIFAVSMRISISIMNKKEF